MLPVLVPSAWVLDVATPPCGASQVEHVLPQSGDPARPTVKPVVRPRS
jgi:hypothetical protein